MGSGRRRASGRVGVMFHGGGFIMGSAKGYRGYAAEVSRVTNARVFVAEYRLAPEHPFPAAIEDANGVLAAAMDEVGPESCFAIGDSAGGGLVLSALWELHREGEPLPACVVLVSPLVDLTVTNASYDERAHVDPIVSRNGIQRNVAFYLAGRGPDDAPAAFPMRSDLGWFPPCLLLVGGGRCCVMTRGIWPSSSRVKGCRSTFASTRTWCMCGRCSRSSCPRRRRRCSRSAPSWASR